MINDIVIRKNESKHIEIIDYLKGFSIITIVLMHLLGYFKGLPGVIRKFSAMGGAGVHVFFLCSGIGLYISYLKTRTTYVQFIRRRFIKIYVPYIIIVVISFLIPWMYVGADRIQALLSHIFLYKMFVPKYESSFGIQLWFVSTIIQFYFAFIPMCIFKEKVKSSKVFIALFMIISISWWMITFAFGIGGERIWGSFFLQYIWEFALGMCIGEWLLNGNEIKLNKRLLLLTAIIGTGVQATMALTSDVLKSFNDVPALIGYISFAIYLYDFKVVRWFSEIISYCSYELYLVHILIMNTMFTLLNPHGLLAQCLCGVVSLVISVIMASCYRLVTKHVSL